MLSRMTSAPWPSVRPLHDLDEVLVAVVDGDLGAQLRAGGELLRRSRRSCRPGPRAALASWIAKVPMPPAPPCTRKRSPGCSPATMNTFDQTVQATSGSAAALDQVDAGGHRHHLAGRDGDALGVPAAGEQRAHLVADRPAGDALADAPRPCRCTPAR